MSQEIVLSETETRPAVARQTPAWMVPTSFGEAAHIAKVIAASGMFKIKSPEACLVVMMRASELGIGLATAFMGMNVIEGRPCMSTDLQLAVVLSKSEKCKYFTCIESTDQQATWETWRVGDPTPVRLTFTLKQAERAGLTKKDNWRSYPEQMLKKRSSAFLARDVYPDLFAGLLSPEEVEDMQAETERRVTVTRQSAPPPAPQTANNDVTDGRAPPESVVEQAHATGQGAPAEIYATIYIEHLLECPAEDMASAGRYLAKYGDMSMAQFSRAVISAFSALVPYQSTPEKLLDLWQRAKRCTCSPDKPQWEAFITAYNKRAFELTDKEAKEVSQ